MIISRPAMLTSALSPVRWPLHGSRIFYVFIVHGAFLSWWFLLRCRLYDRLWYSDVWIVAITFPQSPICWPLKLSFDGTNHQRYAANVFVSYHVIHTSCFRTLRNRQAATIVTLCNFLLALWWLFWLHQADACMADCTLSSWWFLVSPCNDDICNVCSMLTVVCPILYWSLYGHVMLTTLWPLLCWRLKASPYVGFRVIPAILTSVWSMLTSVWPLARLTSVWLLLYWRPQWADNVFGLCIQHLKDVLNAKKRLLYLLYINNNKGRTPGIAFFIVTLNKHVAFLSCLRSNPCLC